MRVLRVYHSGRNPAHRARERALLAAGVDVTLVVPAAWPEQDAEPQMSAEAFPVVELAARRAGDVNRHVYAEPGALARLIREARPDLLDVHEEPYSLAARQWLAAAPADLPIVMYTSQNIDKRLPPPFFWYERRAHERTAALYPCSAQAASVIRGKGFSGLIEILPLGYEAACFYPGAQSLDGGEVVLALVGRLVPEKGVLDAVRVLAGVNAARPARLVCIGSGPEEASARALAARLGLTDRLDVLPWLPSRELAHAYRLAHVVLVTSLLTSRWVEQFGRVIVEAQASGAVVAGYASGSIPEVAGPSAVLAPVGDVDRLTRRVAGLLSDPVGYARRRAEGRENSSTRTWERVAERHACLYEQVLADHARRRLPRSPRTRRAVAAAEFGPPAMTVSGSRPFGLPILRRGGVLPAGLAAAIDLGAEIAARVPERTRRLV
jgi:glycosyltransferase involved in cell wall biosynthesis